MFTDNVLARAGTLAKYRTHLYSATPLRKLLSRFVSVCNTVAYAHSRGILHRDLKPGNIMLTKGGAKLIVADPRGSDLSRHATYFLQHNPDTDVAMLNAMIYTIIEEGLVNEAFIRERTSDYGR